MKRALLLGWILLAGCERGGEWYGTTRPKHPPNELWVNNAGEPEWIDPGKASDAIGGTIIENSFEGLTAPDPATMQPVPGVAERWSVSADNRVWTFHLRADAKWSDGTPVTAHDFVWSWTRVLDPATAAKHAEELYSIENGDAFHGRALLVAKDFEVEGKVEKTRELRDAKLVWMATREEREAALAKGAAKGAKLAGPELLGVRAVDDRTLEVTLQEPISYFLLQITTLHTYRPVPRRAVETHGDLWTRPENIVVNGPFVLREWKFRQHMVFEKNPHYWDRASVKLDRVKVLMVESATVGLQLYKAGEVDFSGENVNLPAEYIPFLRTKKDYVVAPWLATYWYWINVEAPGMTDVRVRRALNMAIDKKAIVEHVTRGGQMPAPVIIKEGLAGWTQNEGDPYDPEKARALLAEAGFPGGRGLPKISILFNTSEVHRAIAEAIQEMWRKELGVDVELANQEWQVFLRDLNEKKFQVARLGWIGDYPDPYSFLAQFTSEAGNNRSNWRNADYDALLARSNAETDPAKRLEMLREAERMILRDVPVIPLYWYTRSRMVKPYVRGIESNFLDRHPWKAIWIEEPAP